MKLRIRGDSVRLRLSQTELSQLVELGTVADAVRFGPASVLTYRLQAAAQPSLSARLEGNELIVTLPRAAVERWQEPTEISVSGTQSIGEGRELAILVEKDFACLAPRKEDQSDLFPNPGAGPC